MYTFAAVSQPDQKSRTVWKSTKVCSAQLWKDAIMQERLQGAVRLRKVYFCWKLLQFVSLTRTAEPCGNQQKYAQRWKDAIMQERLQGSVRLRKVYFCLKLLQFVSLTRRAEPCVNQQKYALRSAGRMPSCSSVCKG